MKDEDITFEILNEEGDKSILFEVIPSEDIDYIAYKALKLECPEYIIPFTTNPSSDSIQIVYAVGANKSNLHNFSEAIQMEQIIFLYNEIISYLEDCGNLFLNRTGFCFNTNYVFLDEQKKSIHFIYVPHKHYSSSEIDIKQIFIELLEKCASNSGEAIQLQLYKYFYKPKFSLREFKKILETLQAQPIKKTVVLSKFEPKPELHPEPEPVFENKSIFEIEPVFETEPPRQTLLDPVPNTKIQEVERSERNNYAQENIDKIIQMASKSNRSDDQLNKESTLINPLEDSEILTSSNLSLSSNTKLESGSKAASKFELPRASTDNNKKKTLFGNIFSTPKDIGVEIPPPDPQEGLRLKLVNVKSKYNLPKTIMINLVGSVFTLGRCGDASESAQSLYEFSQEVNPISRQHAKIEQRGDNYYIIDKGSRNGTFLNGKRIDANKPYQLYHNDIIAFAIAFSDNSIRYVFLEQ